METAPLKSFATWARATLIGEITARIAVVLAPGSSARVERSNVVTALEKAVASAGSGELGRAAVADKVAYIWFNRIIALRFMDANGYTGIGVVSPERGRDNGQPEILAEAKRGNIDSTIISNQQTVETVTGLLDGTRRSEDPQGEAFSLLLANYCRFWNHSMPFMFERESDFTELLMPANLLADDSVIARAVTVLTESVCEDVEVIGWLYQFYISERKEQVFAGFKKNQKAGAAEIPAATQLFTPHWVVRYLLENSLGRLWLLNRPTSRLVDQMEYFVAAVDEETDFLKVSSPEELKIIDPACGSGHMLTYAFDLLFAIYQEEGYAPSDIPGLILSKNLYGTEIDPRAGSLAAFALTMKARARQRTFFTRQVEPNICVLRPLSFTKSELDTLISADGDRDSEEKFWNQFHHSDIIGALIRPDKQLIDPLRRQIGANQTDEENFIDSNLYKRAYQVIRQAEFLTSKYHILAANPPYMGAKNMNAQLSEYSRQQYPITKSDLFSMFIERSFSLIASKGMAAIVTMQSWMFLPTYAPLRHWLAENSSITTLAHLDNMIMGIAFGTSATIWKSQSTSDRGQFFYVETEDITKGRPVSFPPSNRRNTAAKGPVANIYTADNAQFDSIPGRPIAYWISPRIREVFGEGVRLDTVGEPRQGMATSNNGRFLRYAHEVSRSRIHFNAKSREDAAKSSAKWVPYSKGGERRKWYGNHELVVNWENDGHDLIEFAASLYGSASRTIKNTRYYFREALTWSLTSSNGFAARYRPAGFIFDVNGMSSFVETDLEQLLGTVNSSVGSELLAVINPTMALQAGDLKAFPYIPPLNRDLFTDLVHQCVEIAREDWDSQETSWDFSVSPMVRSGRVNEPIRYSFGRLCTEWDSQTTRLRALEEKINSACIDAYGLDEIVSHKVSDSEINLVNNSKFRVSDDRKNHSGRAVIDLVSYAVGCMFGRYSLDKPGFILANQGETLQDYLTKVPSPSFMPDADNVIPIVGDWFEDDIVALFRQFLRAAFGEQNFEENLRFVTDSLGVKNLRDYFVKSFYKDHVQRYKKRPIYWLFSSPDGSFSALIYMHRYTSSTVSTVLNEYLREFKAKLEASRRHHERLAAGTGTTREKAAAQKEVDRLRKVLLELDEYEHDVLYPLATQQIQIDLDDGVKTNYPKFGTALKKIVGLEAKDD